MNLRVEIQHRNYQSWKLYEENTTLEIHSQTFPKINPLELKIFSQDIITQYGELVSSNIRKSNYIAGILLLENNKTFGRTTNKKRLLYKCIPNDISLPIFLVPYELQLGFSKNIKNKYVTFRFIHWNENHPHGLLMETLGDVNILSAFYEYQLYCRHIHHSISHFEKKIRQTFSSKNPDEYIQTIMENPDFIIEDRRQNNEYIFTIDPYGSKDLDDGFSISRFPMLNETTNETMEGWKISIYIANVFVWIESFHLWNEFSERVSSIYLPDKTRTLLPNILSESLCSLLENQIRFAFCMDIYLDENMRVYQHEYKNVLIKVHKNFAYDEPTLLENIHYQHLLNITKKVNEIKENHNTIDSHDVVSYWMIYMNSVCGKKMAEKKIGIFRTVHNKSKSKSNLLNEENKNENYIQDENTWNILKKVQQWKYLQGQYVVYSENTSLEHCIMNETAYIHITSPIRRLIDQLNQILFIQELGLVKKISNDGVYFLHHWIERMDYINTSMRSIRKTQMDCELMTKCVQTPEIMKEIHTCIILDKVDKENGMKTYNVYLDKLKTFSRITTVIDFDFDFENTNTSKKQFKLFYFGDEYHIQQKIKLEIIE
jgi:exoribonuclease R